MSRPTPRRAAGPLLGLALLLSALPLVPAAAQDFYWEAPRPLVDARARYPQFLASGGGVLALFQESEIRGEGEDQEGTAWIGLARKEGEAWTIRRRAVGPLEFRGLEPSLFSAAAGEGSQVALAVAGADGGITVRLSSDGGLSFGPPAAVPSDGAVVGPRLYKLASGGWLLFATRGKDDSLTIYYSRSPDGLAWSPFATFVNGGDGLSLNFLPSAATARDAAGNPVEVVVFQSLVSGARPTFQLFSKVSRDGGATWGPARRVTDFRDPVFRERPEAENFDNQRPHLSSVGGRLWLAWERSARGGNAQAYVANLDAEGAVLPPSVDRVSSGAGTCFAPQVLEIGDGPAALWTDNRRGESRVYLAPRRGLDWPAEDLSGSRGESSFARAAVAGGEVYALWQSSAGGRDRVLVLEPDTTVAPPSLAGVDFAPGVRSRRERVTVRVDLPEDSSGIEGYAWLWSRDPLAEPPREVQVLGGSQNRITRDAGEDGPWYLSAVARDFAGNWSRVARIRYDRDRTPPPPPLLLPPELDERGFLASNTFALGWDPPAADDVAGYTWTLRYVGEPEAAGPRAAGFRVPAGTISLPGLTPYESALVTRAGPPLPPQSLLSASPRAEYRNVDDGYYLFSAAAIDRTGNIGDAATILLRADKFVPYTTVAFADARRDDFGRSVLRVVGRGFLAEGRVLRVVLDRDGREPFDVDRSRAEGGFSIASDRELGGFAFEDLEEGDYRIGLFHEKRGWYWTRAIVAVDAAGTLKFGVPMPPYVPSWRAPAVGRARVSVYDILVALAVLFAAAGILLSLNRTIAVVRDGELVRREVQALLTGAPMPSESRKATVVKVRRRGSRLRLKFTLTFTSLILLVVVLATVPLGYYMVTTQSSNLAAALRERALVLLESVAQGARSYLPAQNVIELGFLPQQSKAMKDAVYITVTGYGSDSATDPEAVWASNDAEVMTKLDSSQLRLGVSRLSDGLTPRVREMVKELDARAAAEVGELNDALAAYTAEGRALALKTDEASQRRLTEISQASRELERSISEKLFALADAAGGSLPDFDPAVAATREGNYLFYKPILFRRAQDQLYYRGMVRLEVSTAIIREAVVSSRDTVFRISAGIAAIAVGIGLVGAFFLSSLIVRPIRKVIEAIEKMRDTEDKEELADFPINRLTNDEIGDLADAANSLKRVLVVAAKESKALEKGSDIQQLLIPLDDAGGDKKYTVGRLDRPEFEIFGYYKGAKKVSGDYWDFRPLGFDNRYFYFMKCDVSGKDVEAAFIMVQVVTMVITHFFDWEALRRKPDYELDKLTYRINDFINGRGYRGKFAAFTLGVYDAKDGSYKLCHAGDKLLHTWKASTRRIEIEELHPTPAAGSFPSELVEMKGPYKTVSRRLDPGDVLLLYTDGIEEAKRHFRDKDFNVMYCESVPKDQPHENHSGGQDGEEFGFERIQEVMSALEGRGRFNLEKHHNPLPEDRTSFDFSSCGESLEERIMALIAIEKAFRLFPDPKVGDEEAVLVDKRIDAFLERHFDQYRLYARRKEVITTKRERRTPDGKIEMMEVEDPNYVIYRGVREDEQYDDLTILGLRRKR